MQQGQFFAAKSRNEAYLFHLQYCVRRLEQPHHCYCKRCLGQHPIPYCNLKTFHRLRDLHGVERTVNMLHVGLVLARLAY